MTMTRSDSSIAYEPDGISDRYAVPFPVFSPEDVYAVLVEGSRETPLTGFSVEGLETEGGVYVRFFTPPPAGPKLVIYRWTRRVQETDYPEGGRFPSKTVEQDFDKLTAMAQEEDDLLKTVVRVPREAGITPAEYLGAFFAAAEETKTARDDANNAASSAAGSAANAKESEENAAAAAAAAAKSAMDAVESVSQGAPSGSETHKGVVRLATREEHEAGTDGLAAVPAHVKKLLDESVKKHAGLPLLHRFWESVTLPPFGCIRCDTDTGLLTREAFPEACAEIFRRYTKGSADVVTDSVYLADVAANGGVTLLFSIGDGTGETFRIPIIGKGMAFCAPWPAMGLATGKYAPDRMQGHWHEVFDTSSRTAYIGTSSSSSGDTVRSGTLASASRMQAKTVISDGVNGTPRSGSITHGPRGVMVPYIKMYGAVTDASEANMAALVAGLPGKLDVARYEAETLERTQRLAPATIKAWAYIDAPGTFIDAYNCTAVSRTATGIFQVYSPAITEKSKIVGMMQYSQSGGAHIIFENHLQVPRVNGMTTFYLQNNSTTTAADSRFTVLII